MDAPSVTGTFLSSSTFSGSSKNSSKKSAASAEREIDLTKDNGKWNHDELLS